MQALADPRHWEQIEVTAAEFRQRMHLINNSGGPIQSLARSGSVYSELALVHQVAKACAQEALPSHARSTVMIEEITNPPLSGSIEADEPVLIQFSYSE